jgi:hypothetical protein
LDTLRIKAAALAEEIKTLASDERAGFVAAAHEQTELARVRSANGNRDTPKKGKKAHVNKHEKP